MQETRPDPSYDALEKYYRILDLHTTATEQEVKQAYRELVKVWHPDRFTHDVKLQKKAEEKLKEINDAYQRIVEHLNNSYTRQQSQQYQKTEKKEKPDSQPPPKQPLNSWICPECLRTNYMDSLSCGCGFKTSAAEIETYKADQTSADLYDAVLFNRSMNYTERANFLARYLLIRFPNSKEADLIKKGSQSAATHERHAEENEEAEENLSGLGQFTTVPYQVEYGGWNWGGFFWGWIWALGNNLPWHLILLSLFIPYVMHFVIGAKGNKWAWQYKRWENTEHFWKTQKRWKKCGIVYWCFILSVIILGIIASINS